MKYKSKRSIIPLMRPNIEPISILEYVSDIESALPFGSNVLNFAIVNGLAIAKINIEIPMMYFGLNSFVNIGSINGKIK